MNYKDKIITFLEKKNELLIGVSGIAYITEEDLNEIKEEWSEKKCKKVWVRLKRETRNGVGKILGAAVCPWCLHTLLINKKTCDSCGYGKRNGRCTFINDNRWHRVFDACKAAFDLSEINYKQNKYPSLRKEMQTKLENIIEELGE